MSLMMALNERYPNAWHMLIERLIWNQIRSGVQVSIGYFGYLIVRKKFLMFFILLDIIIKEIRIKFSNSALRC